MPRMSGYKSGKGKKFKVQSPSTMGKSARKTRPKGMAGRPVPSNGVVGSPSKKGGKRVY